MIPNTAGLEGIVYRSFDDSMKLKRNPGWKTISLSVATFRQQSNGYLTHRKEKTAKPLFQHPS